MESTFWNIRLCKLILKDHTDVERLPGSACFRDADRGSCRERPSRFSRWRPRTSRVVGEPEGYCQ